MYYDLAVFITLIGCIGCLIASSLRTLSWLHCFARDNGLRLESWFHEALAPYYSWAFRLTIAFAAYTSQKVQLQQGAMLQETGPWSYYKVQPIFFHFEMFRESTQTCFSIARGLRAGPTHPPGEGGGGLGGGGGEGGGGGRWGGGRPWSAAGGRGMSGAYQDALCCEKGRVDLRFKARWRMSTVTSSTPTTRLASCDSLEVVITRQFSAFLEYD